VRARVRGRAAIENPVCVEEEEASNQTERLPNADRLELYDGLTPSPP
jgi:hypothetical protein